MSKNNKFNIQGTYRIFVALPKDFRLLEKHVAEVFQEKESDAFIAEKLEYRIISYFWEFVHRKRHKGIRRSNREWNL